MVAAPQRYGGDDRLQIQRNLAVQLNARQRNATLCDAAAATNASQRAPQAIEREREGKKFWASVAAWFWWAKEAVEAEIFSLKLGGAAGGTSTSRRRFWAGRGSIGRQQQANWANGNGNGETRIGAA